MVCSIEREKMKLFLMGTALAVSFASIAMQPRELRLMPDIKLTEGAKILSAVLLGDSDLNEYVQLDSTKHSLEEVYKLHSIFAENFEKRVLDKDTLVAMASNFDFCLAWLNMRGGLSRDIILVQLVGFVFGANDKSFLERLKTHGFQTCRLPQSIFDLADRFAKKSSDEEHK